MQTIGNFQFTMEEKQTQQVEKPGTKPGEGNPQMGSVSIRAMKGNTGIIYVGGAGVKDTNGYELAAGDAVNVDTNSLGGLFAYGTKAGDKLCVLFVGP